LVVLAVVGGVAAAASADINVTPVVTEGKVVASFAAPNAFSDDVREVVQSGLLLTFTYGVELRRPSSVWFDRTVAETTVAASVKFDSLTGIYQVTKLRDGRVVWSERTDKEAEVGGWMTAFDQITLDPTEALESNADYYVRVHLRMSPRRTFSFWPWGRDDGSGRKDFTFIR
ncbi:MAG: DUF4390 domain-containing protein, partial [Vicinamibacterales bacterium]